MVKGYAPASGCFPLLFWAPAASGLLAASVGHSACSTPSTCPKCTVPWWLHSPHLSLVITFQQTHPQPWLPCALEGCLQLALRLWPSPSPRNPASFSMSSGLLPCSASRL